VDVFAIHAVGVGAQRRHGADLLFVARRHEHEVPCPGQQFEVRRGRQFARQPPAAFLSMATRLSPSPL
jgi:hypothetical protein